jgi:lactate 2-monooxygenase
VYIGWHGGRRISRASPMMKPMPDSPFSLPQPGAKSAGRDRQQQIYGLVHTGGSLSIPVCVADLEQNAREVMSRQAWGYVSGGAGNERTMRDNLAAFDRRRIVPRMLRDVCERDTSIELFGRKIPSPVLLGPVGVQGVVHSDGDLASARAASALGVPFVLSTLSSFSIEEVAQASGAGPRWFQLYWGRDAGITTSMVRRAEAAGYSALVVTLDTQMLSWRERDLENRYLPFMLGKGIANFFSDPVFRLQLVQPPEADPATAIRHWGEVFGNTALTWKDLAWLRQNTRLPILLKGILHPDDARQALDCGMDGIVVSNHGGRQVDGCIASLDALPAIAEVVQGKVPILLDSGVRYASDAIKALALGARAVLLGRLFIWGLAVAGEQGVRDVVHNFMADFELTMGLSGVHSCRELDASILSEQ